MKRDPKVSLTLQVLASIQCRSYTNPIRGHELAAKFGVDVREITDIVASLRDNGHKVGSSRGGYDKYIGVDIPVGYFIARTPEEIRSTADMIEQTAKNLLSRRAKLLDFHSLEPTVWEQGEVG